MTEKLTLESMIKKMKETRYCLDCQTEVWGDDYPYHNADHTFTAMTVIEGWGWKKMIEAEEAQRKVWTNQAVVKELIELRGIIDSYTNSLLRTTLTNRIRYRLAELKDSKAENEKR